MSSTLPSSTSSSEISSEAKNDIVLNGLIPQDPKSFPEIIVSLSNGTSGGKTKVAIKKPPPPVQPKSSRFLKKSLTLSSLPKLGHKSSKTRVKEAKEGSCEINGNERVSQSPACQESTGLLRESPLWKLPGISTLKKNRRHSAVDPGIGSPVNVETKIVTTPTEKRKPITTSPHQLRELPPLPTIPPLAVPLPTSSTEKQNGASTETAPNNNAAQVPPTAASDVELITLSISTENSPPAQSDSMSCSVESLTQQGASNPQSSSTPKIEHKFTSNGQTEKADTINSLLEKYNQYVPLRIRVLQGYCSDTADINISTGDLYDVQTVKTTKVVTIRDQDGMTYRVPLESTMKFGLVFNLSTNYDEGLCGYTFRTVSDLTSLSVLPRVVCTQKAFEGNDIRSSVQENEVLVVQQALKSMFRGKRGIKVYSLLTKMEKVLPEDCNIGFSTNPSLVRLHLSDIIEHISNPFPSHAVMYPSADMDDNVPGTLSRVITMLDYSTKQSLIVSSVIGENDDTATDDSTFFEILLDDDMKEIEVSVLKWTTPPESPEVQTSSRNGSVVADSSSYDDDDDHVYDDTINILQSSDTLRTLAEGRRCSNGSPSGRSSPGIHTEGTPPLPDKPRWLSQPIQSDVPVTPKYDNIAPDLPERNRLASYAQTSVEEDPGYDTVGVHLLRSGGNDDSSYNKLHYEGYEGSDSGDPRILSWMEDLQSASNNIESRLMSLERSHGQTAESTEMRRIQTVLEQLAQKIESFDSQLHSLAVLTESPPSSDITAGESPSGHEGLVSEEQSNKNYLRSLDVAKVCELIEAMGLSQYKKDFIAEHVSGEILLECDDQVLQDELGIQSKIHRIRLTKVISGSHSAKSILEQQN